MPKSEKCACGIRIRVHEGKSRRNQLPSLKTDRRGYPQRIPNKKKDLRSRIIEVE